MWPIIRSHRRDNYPHTALLFQFEDIADWWSETEMGQLRVECGESNLKHQRLFRGLGGGGGGCIKPSMAPGGAV